MANTRLSWEALTTICTAAGVIIVDDDVAVYADMVDKERIGLKQFATRFDELYCLLKSKDNQQVESNGSSVWVTAHNGDELQLSVYRPWVVADDATLR